MALAIALTLTRNWNAWEGARAAQVTDDAFVRRDVTPLGTKVRAALLDRMTSSPPTLGRLSAADQRALARILRQLLD